MTFTKWNAGRPLPASQLNENFIHNCGRGSDLLPQDINGNLLTDKSINIGSTTNPFGKIYADQLIQGSVPVGLIGIGTFNGNWTRQLTSFTYSGNVITATFANHGLVTGDFVTFETAQTIVAGTHKITRISANTYQFTIGSTPSGSLGNEFAGIVSVINQKGDFKVGHYWTNYDNKSHDFYSLVLPTVADYNNLIYRVIRNGTSYYYQSTGNTWIEREAIVVGGSITLGGNVYASSNQTKFFCVPMREAVTYAGSNYDLARLASFSVQIFQIS